MRHPRHRQPQSRRRRRHRFRPGLISRSCRRSQRSVRFITLTHFHLPLPYNGNPHPIERKKKKTIVFILGKTQAEHHSLNRVTVCNGRPGKRPPSSSSAPSTPSSPTPLSSALPSTLASTLNSLGFRRPRLRVSSRIRILFMESGRW